MTETLAAAALITEPGVYDDLPIEAYHADPVPGGSLSSSGARKLLAPSCPARFRHEQLHGSGSKPEFDFGSAAHALLLGTGAEIVVIDAKDWRTKAAQQQRDEAREAGLVPLLTAEHDKALAMVAALRANPTIAALFADGTPEQTLVWQDEATGVWRRARPDWLPLRRGDRQIVVDYKTARSVEPSALARAVYDYGYHQQAPWYLDGIKALGLDDQPAFVFVAQEKEPPYLVTVFELDATALRLGRARNRRALEIYRDCTASGVWPGYGDPSDPISYIAMPRWAELRDTEEYL